MSYIEKSQDSGERGGSADGALGAAGSLKHDIKQALKSKKDTAVTRTGMDTRGRVWLYSVYCTELYSTELYIQCSMFYPGTEQGTGK